MSDDELFGIRALKMHQLRMGVEKAAAKSPHTIVELFSTPTCPYCHMAEQYLTAKKISFKKNDVSKDLAAAQRMISATGHTGVPQMHINGQWIVGFDKNSIDEALKE